MTLMTGRRADERHVARRRRRRARRHRRRAGRTLGPTGYRAYADAERETLRGALADAAGLTDRAARPGRLGDAERIVTDAHAEAVEAFLRRHGIAAGDVAGRRLSRPDRAAPAGDAADGAARRRRGAGAPPAHAASSTISAPPTSPRAGRARRSCRCSIALSPTPRGWSRRWRPQRRRRRQRHLHRFRQPAPRLRYRTRQCADRRLDARARRQGLRRERRRRRGGQAGRDAARLAPGAPVLLEGAAEVARPQLVLGPHGRPPVRRGRRGDARRLHGARRRPGRRVRRGGAEALDRRRRRRARTPS